MVDEFAPDAAEQDRLLRLLREARTGNTAALNQLLAAIRPFMKDDIDKLLREQNFRHWDASDVVQDGLLKVAQHLDEVQATSRPQFRAWLAQIARREFLDAARRAQQQKRNVKRQVPLPQDSGGQAQLAADTSSPSQQATRNEEDERREAALRQLSTDDQLVIRLRFHEQREWPDIATRMGRSEAAVKQLYFRALKQWRQDVRASS
jgi:RNA polymerase sigma-70 factor (ECF subfamily)